MSHDKLSCNGKNLKKSSLSRLFAHVFGALLIGVGIVVVFAMGLTVFDRQSVEKENPQTAYFIPFPKNEDMLNQLPREMIEGTALENIAPAGGETSTGDDISKNQPVPVLKH